MTTPGNTKYDAKKFYHFNGKGCPRGAKNDLNDYREADPTCDTKMPVYSPQMTPVDFDTWAYSIANKKQFLAPGLKRHSKANDNFNKIFDGKQYRYVINTDGNLCSVVSKDDVINREMELRQNHSTPEMLDKLEDTLQTLLKNMGVTIDGNIANFKSNQRIKDIQRTRQHASDKEIAYIRSMENPNDVIRPNKRHGCSPRDYFDISENQTRSRYADLDAPRKTNINMRFDSNEIKANQFGGRLPLNYNTQNVNDVACVTPDDMRLTQRKDHAAIYHNLDGLRRVPNTINARGTSLSAKDTGNNHAKLPTGTGELYSIAAVCAQQLEEAECENAESLKVTPFGNKDSHAPADMCAMYPHPVTRNPVCTPKQVVHSKDKGLRDWYFGTDKNPGGFIEKEQLLTEKYRQMNDPESRNSRVIPDSMITGDDLREDVEQIMGVRGIQRFSKQHQYKKRATGNY